MKNFTSKAKILLTTKKFKLSWLPNDAQRFNFNHRADVSFVNLVVESLDRKNILEIKNGQGLIHISINFCTKYPKTTVIVSTSVPFKIMYPQISLGVLSKI